MQNIKYFFNYPYDDKTLAFARYPLFFTSL